MIRWKRRARYAGWVGVAALFVLAAATLGYAASWIFKDHPMLVVATAMALAAASSAMLSWGDR